MCHLIFLLFIFAAVPFIFFWKVFLRMENLTRQNSSSCILYLDIRNSALLSEFIRRGARIVIYALFQY